MTRTTVIHIENQYLKFSVAHFTIFTATERERLHGHNFFVSADITAQVGDNGLCFDYNIMKKRLRLICEQLDEYVLIAGNSPHLQVSESDGEYKIIFNNEQIRLPKTDTMILPLANITAEELSFWLLEKMAPEELASTHGVSALTVAVASGPGQSGSTRWQHGKGIL